MLRTLGLLVAVAGCSSKTRGHVDVVVNDNYALGKTGRDSLVLFMDLDGSTTSTHTDLQGHAAGEVEPGGSVWLAQINPMNSPGVITVYTDVQPGESLELGGPRVQEHSAQATMQTTGTRPSGAEILGAAASCSVPPYNPGSITFDERCATNADVLLTASHLAGGTTGYVLVGYQWLPAQPVVDGGTITADPNGWLPPEVVTLNFANGTPTNVMVRNTLVSSPFGTMPPVGTLAVEGSTMSSRFSLLLPASARTSPVDLDQVLPPAVTSHAMSNGDLEWSVSADNSALRADVLETKYDWVHESSPTYQVQVIMRVLSPPTSAGVIPTVSMPDELSLYQPVGDLPTMGRGRLWRFEGYDGVAPQRLAELALGDGPLLAGFDPHSLIGLTMSASTSIAMTDIVGF